MIGDTACCRDQNRDHHPTEAVEAYLDWITTEDDERDAYITVTEESTREAARKAETAAVLEAPTGVDLTAHRTPLVTAY